MWNVVSRRSKSAVNVVTIASALRRKKLNKKTFKFKQTVKSYSFLMFHFLDFLREGSVKYKFFVRL